MVDHRTGRSTRLLRKAWKVDEPLADELFDPRKLAQ